MNRIVNISMDTLLRECSIDKDNINKNFTYFCLINRENVHEVFKFKKFNNDFVSKVSCYTDPEHIIGRIRPSYDLFLSDVLAMLNMKNNNIIDNEELTNSMLDKVKELESITNEYDLRSKFPYIYRDLINGRDYLGTLQSRKNKGQCSEEEYDDKEHYFYSCAMRRSLSNFVKMQALMYRRFINDRDKFKEKVENTSFNPYIKSNFDLNKLCMYVIHQYLSICENSKDKEEFKYYIKKVQDYLTGNDYSKDCSITIDSGIKIDISVIKTRYNNLKKDSMVEWVLIPKGKEYRVVKQEKEPVITLMNYEEIENLRQAGERKKVFYESTNYLAKAIGLKRYRGYIAYIYENGEVILDREYNQDAVSTAKGNAIYNMKVVDFSHLSKLDKKVLMKHPKVGRIYHSSKWEEKVKEIIEREATKEEKQTTYEFVDKLKKKKIK